MLIGREKKGAGKKKRHARHPAWHGFCLTLTWIAFSSPICLVSSCLRPPGMATADGAPWLLFSCSFSEQELAASAGPSSVSMHWIRSAQREGSEGTACIHATRGNSEFEPSSLPVPQPQGNGSKEKAATGHGRERQQRQSACLVLSVSVCMLWRTQYVFFKMPACIPFLFQKQSRAPPVAATGHMEGEGGWGGRAATAVIQGCHLWLAANIHNPRIVSVFQSDCTVCGNEHTQQIVFCTFIYMDTRQTSLHKQRICIISAIIKDTYMLYLDL